MCHRDTPPTHRDSKNEPHMNRNHGAEQYPLILMPDGTTMPVNVPKIRQRPPEAYAMTFLGAMAELAENENLRPTDIRLALMLASSTDYENWILATPTQAAKRLKVDRSAIYHGMRRLKEAGILEYIEPTDQHRRHGWRFSNAFLWRGKVKNLHDERKRRLQAVAKAPAHEEA